MKSDLKMNHSFINPFVHQELERAYGVMLYSRHIVQIENLVHNYLTQMAEEEKRKNEEFQNYIRSSRYVIEELKRTLAYAQHKNSQKMRMTKQEFERVMRLLSEEAAKEVYAWVDSQGGLENYLAPEWGKNEP